jgi:predicted nucleotidyltransferase
VIESRVFSALRSGLQGHAYALIGAGARNAWAPPRATTDIDFALSASVDAVEVITGLLQPLGYACVRRQQADPGDAVPDIVIFRAEGQPQVDILLAKTPFERQALTRAVPLELEDGTVPVVSVEDLIVYKLIADRRRDRDDIQAVLRTQIRAGRTIDWPYIEHWAAEWGVSDRAKRLRD